MAEYTYSEDIDALAAFLLRVRDGDDPWADPDHAKDWSRALTALIAERDELRKRVAVLESQEFTLPHEPFRDPDRDRRDDLVCSLFPILLAAAWSRQTASTTAAEMADTHAAMRELALVEADKMLAAMRKEGPPRRSIGSRTNWADKIIAAMRKGDANA